MTKIEREFKKDQNRQIGTVDATTATKITKDTAFLTVQGFAYTGSQSEMKATLGLWIISVYMYLAFDLFVLGHGWSEVDWSTPIMWLIIYFPFVLFQIYKWRREIPICFSRKKQKVFYWENNELLEVSWKNFEFYYAKHPGAGPSVSSYGDAFDLRGKKSKKIYKIFANYQGGYSGISRYMRGEGFLLTKKEKIDILRGNFRFGCKDAILSTYNDFLETQFNEPLFPIVFFMAPVHFILSILLTLPTRVMVLVLNKILPRKKLPAELLEACGLDKDYKVYG